MVFEKKMIILTGNGKGVLKTESNALGFSGELALYGVPSEKAKYLIVKDGENLCEYELGYEQKITFKFERKFSANAHFIVSDHQKVLLYGTLAKNKFWIANLPVEVEKKIEKKIDAPTQESGFEYSSRSSLDDIFPSQEGYLDNAVELVNYYEGRLSEEKESVRVSEKSEEIKQISKCEMDRKVGLREMAKVKRAQASENELRKKMESVSEGASFLVPQTQSEEVIHASVREMTYYERVSNQIEKLFSLGERDKSLEQLLPFTKWVKIDYDGRDKKFVVGLIGEKPDYICYGLPGKYSPIPPSELQGYCQWLPLDVTNPHGRGYWLIYQSADTGESITR